MKQGAAWAVLACALLATASALADRSSGIDVVVEVTADAGVGAGELRGELARLLAGEIEARHCVGRVLGPAEGAEAPTAHVFHLHLTRVEQETTYDASLAQSVNPYAPPGSEADHTANIEIDGHSEWLPHGRSDAAKADRWHHATSWRPRIPGEDAAAAAREEALLELARRISKKVCKRAGKAGS